MKAKYKSPILGDVVISTPLRNNGGVYHFTVETKKDTYSIELTLKSHRKALEEAERIFLNGKN